MGKVNNGAHQVNLSIPKITVAPSEVAAFSYAIVNTGFASDSVEQALQKFVAAAASKGAGAAELGGLAGGLPGALLTSLGAASVAWAAQKLEGIVFADCWKGHGLSRGLCRKFRVLRRLVNHRAHPTTCGGTWVNS
jgi:hypothetical protein